MKIRNSRGDLLLSNMLGLTISTIMLTVITIVFVYVLEVRAKASANADDVLSTIDSTQQLVFDIHSTEDMSINEDASVLTLKLSGFNEVIYEIKNNSLIRNGYSVCYAGEGSLMGYEGRNIYVELVTRTGFHVPVSAYYIKCNDN